MSESSKFELVRRSQTPVGMYKFVHDPYERVVWFLEAIASLVVTFSLTHSVTQSLTQSLTQVILQH